METPAPTSSTDQQEGEAHAAVSFSCMVFGKPEPAGSKRAFVNPASGRAMVTDANPNASKWKSHVQSAVGEAWSARGHGLLEGPVRLSLRFFLTRPKGHFNTKGELNAQGRRRPYPTVKPDTTKLVRGVEDALTGIVWRDDVQVVSQTASKVYGDTTGVSILVEEIREESLAAAFRAD